MHQDAHRLPRTVQPLHYELTLRPDLDGYTFSGEARIGVRVMEPVTEVVLNAVELDVLSAELVGAGHTPNLPATAVYEQEEERLRLVLPAPADAGDWTLRLDFAGRMNEKLRGFYRSTFRDLDGRERAIGTTQFEATDARRAFPCWDEPDRKATFALTLEIDGGLTAVSNTAVVSSACLPGGRQRIEFARTIPIASECCSEIGTTE